MNQNNRSQKYVALGIFILALISFGLFFVFNNNNGNSTNNGSNGGNNQNIPTTDVYFEGFTFRVPTNQDYEISGDIISFGDSADTWYATVKVITGDYNNIISNKNQVVSEMQTSGYQVKTYDQKTASGLPCLMMEVDRLSQKMIVGYVKADSSKIFVVSVFNVYKEYDYSIFEDTVKILKTGL